MKPRLHIKNVSLLTFLLVVFSLGQTWGFEYQGYHWPPPNPMGEPYLINPNCADPAAENPDDQIIAIRDGGARAWMNEGNANFTFTYGGTTTKPLPDDGVVSSYNGSNEIMFVQDPAYHYFVDHNNTVAVVFYWYWTSTREIFECDMAFHDVKYTFNGVGQPTSQEHDIWNLATHEFGHFLNLKDLYTGADIEKTMYGWVSKGETKKRDLHQDDIDGIQYIYGQTSNSNPTLTAGYVSPDSGYLDTEFSYYVDYYDANGDAPTTAQVYIDEVPYTMSLHSGIASDGTYRYQTALPDPGIYDYYFYFQEANGGHDREPVLWTNPGPTVENRAPALSNGYVTPTEGSLDDTFDFYVTHFDDQDTPSVADIYVDGVPYAMELISGSPSNGTYHYQTGFSERGVHTFFFYFEDDFGLSARLPIFGTLSLTVINREPTLSEGYVIPTVGTPEDTFDFYVAYSDPDEDTPSVADVYIDYAPHAMELDSGSASNGRYHYQTGFAETGEHQFYFYFEDGFGGAGRFPASDSLSLIVFKYGDVNADGEIGPADVVYLINYFFRNGDPPDPLPAGDCNCNGSIDPGDVIYLLNYLFRGWPPPSC
jgi:hypothetical protein